MALIRKHGVLVAGMKAYVWHVQHEMVYKAAYRMRVKNMITTRQQRSLSAAGLHIEFSSCGAAGAIGAKKNPNLFFFTNDTC